MALSKLNAFPQQEIISYDRIWSLVGGGVDAEDRPVWLPIDFYAGVRTFCYALRGLSMRSHTIHVASVQDHCFGRTSAIRSFNERRTRISKSSRIPPLLFLARERRKPRYLAVPRFWSLLPSNVFAFSIPNRNRVRSRSRTNKSTENKRDLRIQCLPTRDR